MKPGLPQITPDLTALLMHVSKNFYILEGYAHCEHSPVDYPFNKSSMLRLPQLGESSVLLLSSTYVLVHTLTHTRNALHIDELEITNADVVSQPRQGPEKPLSGITKFIQCNKIINKINCYQQQSASKK